LFELVIDKHQHARHALVCHMDQSNETQDGINFYRMYNVDPSALLCCSRCIVVLLCVRRSCGGHFCVHIMALAMTIVERYTALRNVGQKPIDNFLYLHTPK
jgi:hypothetical protein